VEVFETEGGFGTVLREARFQVFEVHVSNLVFQEERMPNVGGCSQLLMEFSASGFWSHDG